MVLFAVSGATTCLLPDIYTYKYLIIYNMHSGQTQRVESDTDGRQVAKGHVNLTPSKQVGFKAGLEEVQTVHRTDG